jgi:hypothetical protein
MMDNEPRLFQQPTWYQIVTYDQASDLLGETSNAFLDRLDGQVCLSRARGAWDANDRDSHVAYRSAAVHKGMTVWRPGVMGAAEL